jgi:hypothetical protein
MDNEERQNCAQNAGTGRISGNPGWPGTPDMVPVVRLLPPGLAAVAPHGNARYYVAFTY